MYLVMTIKAGLPDDLVWLGNNYEQGKKVFLDRCSTDVSNWDEYDAEDIEACLNDGYCEYGRISAVVFLDLTNLTGGLFTVQSMKMVRYGLLEWREVCDEVADPNTESGKRMAHMIEEIDENGKISLTVD